jgi:RNA polymerase sigma-70 factor (ECF subfamily)
MADRHEVTVLLGQVQSGQREATDRLLTLVYDDLRALARRQLSGQAPGHTLQPTALVHEAYVRLVGPAGDKLNNREHFLAVAAKAMRCILIDHARGKGRDKRGGGGGWERVELDQVVTGAADRGVDLIVLEEALIRLEAVNPERVRLIEFRFFAGLTLEEAGAVLGVSLATVKREWAATKVWLFRALAVDGAQSRAHG